MEDDLARGLRDGEADPTLAVREGQRRTAFVLGFEARKALNAQPDPAGHRDVEAPLARVPRIVAHEKGLELFPNSALSEGVLSTLEAKAGDPAVALKRTEDALSFRPDQPVLRLNRVVLLARTGRTDEAIKAAEELTEVKEIASEAHRQLAILYDRYRPDPTAALTHYRESLPLAPERPDREQIRRRIASLERTTH